jgi:hypothetical protein
MAIWQGTSAEKVDRKSPFKSDTSPPFLTTFNTSFSRHTKDTAADTQSAHLNLNRICQHFCCIETSFGLYHILPEGPRPGALAFATESARKLGSNLTACFDTLILGTILQHSWGHVFGC